jgi:PAS domain S-box-containing protein
MDRIPSAPRGLILALSYLTRALEAGARSKAVRGAPLPAEARAPLDDVARALARVIEKEGSGPAHAWILLAAGRRPRLIGSSAGAGKDGEAAFPPLPALEDLSGRDAPLFVRASSQDPLAAALRREAEPPLGALWVVPLRAGTKAAGAVAIGLERGEEPPPEAARAALEATASLLSRALLPGKSAPPGRRRSRGAPRPPTAGTALPRAPIIEGNYEQFLEKIIQTSVDGVVAADLQGRILLFNTGAERISGYRAEEVIGRLNVRDLYASNVAREIMRRLRSPGFGGRGRLEHCVEAFRTKEGIEIPIHLSAATIYENGEERATVGVFTDLRDFLRLEKDIRESEELYRNVVEQAHEGIGIVQGGRLRFANRHLREMLGISARLQRPVPLSDFIDAEVLRGIGLLSSRGKSGARAGSPPSQAAEAETVLQAADGTTLVIEILVSAIRRRGMTAQQIFVRDISARRELENTYRLLVDTAGRAHQGIVLSREEIFEPGAIIYANEEFCRFTGWTLEELQHIRLTELFTPEGMKEARRVYRAMLRGEEAPPAERTFLHTKGGGRITVEVSTARTVHQGKPAIIGYCRDVTDQAELEEVIDRQGRALIEKNRELEDMIKRLRSTQDTLIEQQKLAEIGTFSAGIAHEIRNPLGLIRSHLRVLQEARDRSGREPAVLGIERQINRTSEFIDKILSYARPTAPVRRRLDLNRTLSMAARFATEALSPPGAVSIRKEFQEGLPLILGDHAQLQEVFINLITNALQAMGKAGTVRLVTALDGRERVRVEVIDSGPGIPEGDLPKIFLPFFTSGKGPSGTGMGLAISKRIVEGHLGRIVADRMPEKGMRFRVVLPAT